MPASSMSPEEALKKARQEFISHWGTMGGAWGVNRTMSQIHALLMTSDHPLTTDEVMEELQISRGNAHQNLRDLLEWGLVRSVIRKGERKEYFESEKDVWKMFCCISRVRKRREVEPVLAALVSCEQQTRDLSGPAAQSFHRQIKALADFVSLADSVMERVARSEQSTLMPVVAKFLGASLEGPQGSSDAKARRSGEGHRPN